VSKGNVKKVPDVTGQSEAAAKAQLNASGFASKVLSREVTDSTQVGVVIGQDPDGNFNGQPGKTVVTIVVGTAPPPPPSSAPPSGTPSATPSSGRGGGLLLVP
jgi:serine/threonine-protein kinase